MRVELNINNNIPPEPAQLTSENHYGKKDGLILILDNKYNGPDIILLYTTVAFIN